MIRTNPPNILTLKQLILAGSLLAGLGLLSAQPLAQQARYRPDHVLVKPNGAVNQLAAVHAQLGSQVRRSFPRFGNLQEVKLPPGVSVEEMLIAYQRSGLVEYAEPDYVVIDASTNHANDPFYTSGTNWNMNNTNFDADIDRLGANLFGLAITAVTCAPLRNLRLALFS